MQSKDFVKLTSIYQMIWGFPGCEDSSNFLPDFHLQLSWLNIRNPRVNDGKSVACLAAKVGKEFKIATYIDSSWLVKHTILHMQSSMAKCNHHNCLLLCQRKVNWVVLLILLRAQAIYFLGRDTVNIVVSKPSIHLCHNAFQCQKTQKKNIVMNIEYISPFFLKRYWPLDHSKIFASCRHAPSVGIPN